MEKAELIGKINTALDELKPVLLACRIATRPLTDSVREKRLESVLESLAGFMVSDAVQIFRQVEALRVPGVLAAWVADENLRGAREAQLYIKAVDLVRALWRESEPLPQFFRRREPQCRIRTKSPNEKELLLPGDSVLNDRETVTDTVECV